MPRIDPLSLLKCLSVLLGPTGGIKSKDEVHRLANLMTKFSKKLVSKCIYIQILKTTETDLLSQFMGAGGWNLVHMWLTDGILAKNWALIQELLELLLLCPVDIERLKSNNCPKLIKGLSKEGSHQGVRVLASRLVEQWLKIVKGEAAPNSVPAQIMTVPGSSKPSAIPTAIVHPRPASVISSTQISCSENDATDKTMQLVQSNSSSIDETLGNQQVEQSNDSHYQLSEKASVQPVSSPMVNKPSGQTQCQPNSSQLQKKQSFVVVSSAQSSIPVYKITIRDGKKVLTKLETDASHINNLANHSSADINAESTNDALESQNSRVAEANSSQNFEDLTSNKTVKAKTEAVTESTNRDPSETTSVISSKDTCETDNIDIKVKDNKDIKPDIVSDSNKSVSDKENRDSSKKESDKKSSSSSGSSSSSSDKKNSHHHSSSSSSKSSSKHSSSSSSSHRSSSNSHRSSSHRSSSKSSSSKDRAKEKDKDKHHSSSSSKHSSSNKSKSERDKEREKEKEKLKKDQAEKDKATLEKVQGPALSLKLGKIPKKKTDDEKSNDVAPKRLSIESKESKDKDKNDTKKGSPVSEKKNISISIENRKTSQDSTTRPKTVKTFNSKFRSTGLEEEAKPPPPRSVKKPNPVNDKKIIPPKITSLKRSSPLRESSSSADKRVKLSLENPVTPPNEEKKGGIKLIPPKPKPMVLQESDMFMDALTASTKIKEPRKRKRRTSLSKDGPPETKKLDISNSESNRDISSPLVSPSSTTGSHKNEDKTLLKPNFKFYQDTLETEEDKERKGKGKSDGVSDKSKENGDGDAEEERDDDEEDEDEEEDEDNHKNNKDIKESNEDDERSRTPTPEDNFGDKSIDSTQDSDSSKKDVRYVDGLRSVLLLQKRKGPKKSLKWKVDLESIRYFELDETERVNVTKTFTDMKQIEKQNEREAFQMARKLCTEDTMEEKTRWRALVPIDTPPALVEPGKDSIEKDIQYAREKGILQAIYFHRNMIPDTPAEPEEERLLPMIDAKVIPLDDLTGTGASEKDFTTTPWPEPKPHLTSVQPVSMTNFHYPPFPHNQQPMVPPPMVPPQQAPMGPMPQMPPPMMNPMNQMGAEMGGGPLPPGGGGWRTGDGKVVVPDIGMNPMPNIPGGFPPQGIEGQMGPPPGMMGPPMYNQPDGFMMGPDDMGYNNAPNNFQGPPGPVMFGPGPNFQGGPPRGGGPMHVNRGRGAPGAGWFRGGPPVRGVGWRGGWRGNAKQPPVCRQFSKSGYCRAENKCQFLHPGVNCPPF